VSRARCWNAPWIAAALLVAGALEARAAGDASGTAAGGFLSLGSGASVLSMGGATLASGSDLASASWNVASLSRLDGLQFSLAHAPLPGGASQEWLAAGGRVGSGQTRWGIQSLVHREGDMEGRDAANNPTGSLSATDVAVSARLAHALGRYASAGIGGEWVHESLAGVTGAGMGFEAGLRADAGPIGLAVAARHLGGRMRYADATYDLPAVFAGGVSWSDAARGLRVNADFESPSHYYNSLRLGGEWMWRGRVAMRAGYRLALSAPSETQISGVAFGAGTGVGAMWVDYSFLPEGGESSGEHRVGITFRPRVLEAIGGALRETRPAAVQAPRARVEPAARPAKVEPAARPDKVEPSEPRPSPVLPKAIPAASVPTPAPARTPTPADTAPPKAAAVAPAGPGVSGNPPPATSMPIVRPTWVVVAPGETMSQIAKRWNTSVPAIMMTNDLVSDQVTVGQQLRLPPAQKPSR
jgi:LysM repeat protein